MPALSLFPIKTLSQFEKRDYAGDKGVDDRGGESPVAILGLVVAALTLLVGIMSLGSSRFRRWVFGLLPSQFVKKAFRIALPNPVPTIITTAEDLRFIPVAGVSVPGPVFIYNVYANPRPVCSRSNTFPYGHGGVAREGGRVPQVEELLGPRRPEPVAAGRFP
ncbi:hypothetical protein HOY80DRAFT_1136908 [Tuber brumale]|nr:hypothetical protein HOY80DRAFT_1136908 [Tuber brumale]